MSLKTFNVAVFGAAGESGSTIVDGLLESTSPSFASSRLSQRHFSKFLLPIARITDNSAKEVTALARPSSISKPVYEKLRERSVDVVAIDLDKPETKIANVIKGFQILIVSVHPAGIGSQVALVRAAKLAGLERFIPSAFAMAVSPSANSSVQKVKEEVYAELRAISLPYTIIDVGWWYHGFIPQLVPGRTDYTVVMPEFMRNLVPGDGNIPTHVVNYADIGKLIARHRRRAFRREYCEERAQGLQSMIADFDAQLQKNPQDALAAMGKFCSEYYYSSFINGDNSPKGFSRLGYLLATDLYPDFQSTRFQHFFLEVLRGKVRIPYSGK
ncbi:isoflavone reductase family protein [Colletotrichum phormii]|uniref:Isoflavone reductase family protein n=1 Tax=Colletotrichum phormii TaxID=359342 RepID=A0AAJ0EJ38_9PEZI|nr:isoflavone reductase family protein [Colletotrichum phormii]KAK1638530.1 isoflavone reductase family protein [Colletotrichum phormii]